MHDVDYFDEYIALKALYPTATWHELTGNHESAVEAAFKTKLGIDPIDRVVAVGNCAFVMVAFSTGDKSSHINNSLDANTDKNCFICHHEGRKDTVTATDIDYCDIAANIDTGLATRKFIAWFSAHSHGYTAWTRQLTTAKYLNLGDNN